MERRALYHSLRVNRQLDPKIDVESWKVEDYRQISFEELFSRLNDLGLNIDGEQLIALAESEENPEDFAETLLPDDVEDPEVADQIYLIVFELWRRFLSARPTLSIFCDEWDYQIDSYETGQLEGFEKLNGLICRFTALLEDAVDRDEDPKLLFQSVVNGCAHDIEEFLYDFAAAQIEEENFSYAQDIIDAFLPFSLEKHWLSLLSAEILSRNSPEEGSLAIRELLKECASFKSLSFNLEFLAFLARLGESQFFVQLVKFTIPLLEIEEDFWDFLSSCENFFHFKDDEIHENWVKALRARRSKIDPYLSIPSNDSDICEIQKVLLK